MAPNPLPDQSARDAVDAVRLLAGCYDDELLRSDHVLDDLFERELLTLSADITGEYTTVLTRQGRQMIVRLLSADQEQAESAALDEDSTKEDQ